MKMWSPFRREAAGSTDNVRRGLAEFRDRVLPASSSGSTPGAAMARTQADYIAAKALDQKVPSQLFYRGGYLLTEAPLDEQEFRSFFPFLGNWKVRQLGALTLAHDAQSTPVMAEADAGSVVIIGDVFDCFDPSREAAEVAADLLPGLQDDRRLFEVLDRLGGRFVCILSSGQDVRVYNDAFGARSLYISSSPWRTVASHAFLISLLHGKTLLDGALLFLSSRAYAQRDVKYLPGISTAFNDIYLCPPNNCFCFHDGRIRRYWPREDLRPATDREALDTLVSVLEAVADHYSRRYRSHLFGLTSGYDSRPMFSALAARGAPIQAFTLFRNEAQSGSKSDVEVAQNLSGKAGAKHKTIDMTVKPTHRELFSRTMMEMSKATGYYRLGAPYSTVRLLETFGPDRDRVYLRGFGGEILRGFYQSTGKGISAPTPEQFARAYGVADGSTFTRGLFRQMLDVLDYRTTYNVDLNDLFYWEHRMGAWASTALMETDPVALTVPAYNCRRLYETFLSLPLEARASRWHFKEAVRHFRPDFLDS